MDVVKITRENLSTNNLYYVYTYIYILTCLLTSQFTYQVRKLANIQTSLANIVDNLVNISK